MAEVDGTTCANCGADAPGAYCASCGQATDVDPKSLRVWIRHFLEETIALDGKLWRTLHALLFKPGFLAKEWEQGRRAAWTHPLRLYLLTSFVFIGMTLIAPDTGAVRASTTGTSPTASAVASDLQSDRLLEALQANYAYMMFVLVPLFALWMKVLYWRSGIYYVGHLVHALHIHAAAFLLIAISLLFEGVESPWDYVTQGPFIAWMLLYALPSGKIAYGVSWIGAALRTFVLLPVHLTSVMAGFLVVAFASGTFNATAAVEDAHAKYWEVREAFARGDSAHAEELLPDVVADYLRVEYVWYSPRLLAHLADAHLMSGRVELARLEADRALIADPDHVVALGVAARAAAEAGDSAATTELWTRYLDAFPPLDSFSAVAGPHSTDLIRDRDVARAWLGVSEGRAPPPADSIN